MVTYLILSLLIGILVFAHPKMRAKYHDSFEAIHRFVGWIATALVWVQVCVELVSLRNAVDPSPPDRFSDQRL